VCDLPTLPRPSRDQRGLLTRGRNVKHELDPQLAHGVDNRVDPWVVLPGLEFDDPRLRHPKPLGQSSLTEPVLHAIAEKDRSELASRSEPLPLRPKAGVSKLLFGDERIKDFFGSGHADHDNKLIIGINGGVQGIESLACGRIA